MSARPPLPGRTTAAPPERARRVFDAVDVRSIQRWLESEGAGGLAVTSRPAVDTREVYYDTDDWRLHRAGLTLCLRETSGGVEALLAPAHESGAGDADGNVQADRERQDGRTTSPVGSLASSKGSSTRSASLSELRVAQDVPAVDATLLRNTNGQVGRRLALLTGAHLLVRRVELRVVTRAFELSRAATAVVVWLRRVDIPLADGQSPAHLDRVEIEVSGSNDPDVARMVDPLRRVFGLRPATTSHFSAALQALGQSVPSLPDLGATTLEPSAAIGDLAMVVLRRQFAKVRAHEAGTRLGDDPEELHDMRVAIRRMRVAFKLFAAYLPARALRLRHELKWAGDALGEVRDLDVQIEGVLAMGRDFNPSERHALAGLMAPLEEQRRVARRRLIRALDSRRFGRLGDRMTATLARGPLRSDPSHRLPALAVAPQLIERCYTRVVRNARRLKKSSRPEYFHRLRIRFKILRYTLEFHRDLYGKATDDVIRAIADLQQLLGAHQDADVATRWTEQTVKSQGRRLSPETLFVAGRVSERYARRARRLRRRFPRAYAHLRSRSWHRLRRRVETLRISSMCTPAAVRRVATEPTEVEDDPLPSAGPVVVDLRSRRG